MQKIHIEANDPVKDKEIFKQNGHLCHKGENEWKKESPSMDTFLEYVSQSSFDPLSTF